MRYLPLKLDGGELRSVLSELERRKLRCVQWRLGGFCMRYLPLKLEGGELPSVRSELERRKLRYV